MKHPATTQHPSLFAVMLACLSCSLLVPLGHAANGSLLGSVSGPIEPDTVVDLTAEGPSDWACWGRTSATSFDHKATGGGQISDITKIGAGAHIQNNPTGITITWSDGTPELSVEGHTNNVRTETVGSGFALPCQPIQRRGG
ncbi:MAG: hypothetical protein L0Z50_23490 [Verrucomicrobiales bacterium]|nr:hypothetical protein [Verrucomicrobiales bacterium]